MIKQSFTKIKKDVWLLTLSQAIFVSATIISFMFASLVGKALASNAMNATLPVAITGLGTMLSTLPFSLLMKRIGRKNGFIVGTLLGAISGTLGYIAIKDASFSLFCFSMVFMGFYQAFAQYYRYAASEAVDTNLISRTISFILVGGVVGAMLGPMIGTASHHLSNNDHYATAYLMVLFVSLFGTFVCTLLNKSQSHQPSPNKTAEDKTLISDKLKLLLKKDNYTAISNASIGYFLMILLMTATPLAMQSKGFNIAQIGYIIQLHLLGMYLPSFFTGRLIYRYGIKKIFVSGILLLLLSASCVYSGNAFWQFAIALIFTGVGWNFLYIAGSTLLAHTQAPGEKAIVQGINEVSIFTTSAIASYLAGLLLYTIGWHAIGLFCLTFLVISAMITYHYKNTSERRA